MKTSIEINLKPFYVPNFVIAIDPARPREEGFVETRSFALSELDPVTLEKMCEAFTTGIFKKAGKQRPPQAV